MTSLEETFRTVLAARLPDDPKWTVWIDGTVAELAAAVPVQGIDQEALADALMRVYDHGTQPNAFREADEVIRLLSLPVEAR